MFKRIETTFRRRIKIKEKILHVQLDLEDINSSIEVDSSTAVSLKSCDLNTNNNSANDSKIFKTDFNLKESINKENDLNDGKLKNLIEERIALEKESIRLENALQNHISKRTEVIKNSYNKQMRDFYKDHILSLLQAHDSKLSLMEKDKDEKYANYCLDKKNLYIKQLENQLNLRDKIIKDKNLIDEIHSNDEIKTIKELKKMYRLPKIKNNITNNLQTIETNNISIMNNNVSITNNRLNKFSNSRGKVYNNNLPPVKNARNIYSGTHNINALPALSEKVRVNIYLEYRNRSSE